MTDAAEVNMGAAEAMIEVADWMASPKVGDVVEAMFESFFKGANLRKTFAGSLLSS